MANPITKEQYVKRGGAVGYDQYLSNWKKNEASSAANEGFSATASNIQQGVTPEPKAITPAQGTPVGMKNEPIVSGVLKSANLPGVKEAFTPSAQIADKGKMVVDAYNKQLAAEQSKTAAGAPAQSAPGENETPEQAQARALADAQAQAEYYKKKEEERIKDLAGVSGQMADFGARLNEFMSQNQQTVNALNSTLAGLGDKSAKIATELLSKGIEVDLNNKAIQEQLYNNAINLPPEQQEQALRSVLEASGTQIAQKPATALKTEPIKPATAGGLTPEAPIVDIANAEKSAFMQSGSQDLATLIKDISAMGGDGSDFNSGDLNLLALKTTVFSNEKMRAEMEKFYTERANRIAEQQNTYTDYWNGRRAEGTDLLTQMRDEKLRRNDLQEQRILAQKDRKMSELQGKTERYESFVKAQMTAMGFPVEGQMGTTMLINSMAKWEDFVASTEFEFDDKIANLHDKSIDIIDGYVKDLFDLNGSIDEKVMNQQEKSIEREEKNESDFMMSEMQMNLANTQAMTDFLKAKQTEKAEMQKQAFELQKDAEKRMWDLQAEGIKASGGIVTVGSDGMPTWMVDENGVMVDSLEAQKIYQQMALDSIEVTTNEYGEVILVDKLKRTTSSLGKNNPNNNFPHKGLSVGGEFTINVNGENIYNSQKFTGQSQCVGGARVFNKDLPGGLDNILDKRAIYSGMRDFSEMQPGDNVFFNGGEVVQSRFSGTNAKVGHAATIESIDWENQTVRVVDVNYNGDNKWGVNVFKFDQIDRDPATNNLGIFRGANPIIPTISGDMEIEAIPSKEYTSAQRLAMESIDLEKGVDKQAEAQMRKLGLDINDVYEYRSGSGLKLTPEKESQFKDIIYSVKELRQHKGLKGGVGFSLSKIPIWDKAIKGTKTAGFMAKYDSFIGKLTLPNLDKLKGAMSDNDIRFIKSASSALNTDMREDEFLETLDEIEGTYNKYLNKGPSVSVDFSALGKNATSDQVKSLLIRSGMVGEDAPTDEDIEYILNQLK